MVFQQKLTILTVLPSVYTEYLLALSGALVFIMVYYIPSKATFFKFGAILHIHSYSLSLSFSIQYTELNQAILLHELH